MFLRKTRYGSLGTKPSVPAAFWRPAPHVHSNRVFGELWFETRENSIFDNMKTFSY